VDRQTSKTHVLVTGGAGFIGQRLAGVLLSSGAPHLAEGFERILARFQQPTPSLGAAPAAPPA